MMQGSGPARLSPARGLLRPIVVLLSLLCLPLLSRADEEEDACPEGAMRDAEGRCVAYKGATEIDFDALDVAGDLQKAMGTLIDAQLMDNVQCVEEFEAGMKNLDVPTTPMVAYQLCLGIGAVEEALVEQLTRSGTCPAEVDTSVIIRITEAFRAEPLDPDVGDLLAFARDPLAPSQGAHMPVGCRYDMRGKLLREHEQRATTLFFCPSPDRCWVQTEGWGSSDVPPEVRAYRRHQLPWGQVLRADEKTNLEHRLCPPTDTSSCLPKSTSSRQLDGEQRRGALPDLLLIPLGTQRDHQLYLKYEIGGSRSYSFELIFVQTPDRFELLATDLRDLEFEFRKLIVQAEDAEQRKSFKEEQRKVRAMARKLERAASFLLKMTALVREGTREDKGEAEQDALPSWGYSSSGQGQLEIARNRYFDLEDRLGDLDVSLQEAIALRDRLVGTSEPVRDPEREEQFELPELVPAVTFEEISSPSEPVQDSPVGVADEEVAAAVPGDEAAHVVVGESANPDQPAPAGQRHRLRSLLSSASCWKAKTEAVAYRRAGGRPPAKLLEIEPAEGWEVSLSRSGAKDLLLIQAVWSGGGELSAKSPVAVLSCQPSGSDAPEPVSLELRLEPGLEGIAAAPPE